jgi:hypothetical protein
MLSPTGPNNEHTTARNPAHKNRVCQLSHPPPQLLCLLAHLSLSALHHHMQPIMCPDHSQAWR